MVSNIGQPTPRRTKWLSVAGSLQLEQLGIATTLCDKFFVCPGGFHLTVGKDENAVGHADAGKTVGDQDCRFAFTQFLEAPEHFVF
jgi:hypothetical protein